MTDKIKTAISCKDDYDPDSLDCDLAQQAILNAIETTIGTEYLAIRSALDRVLAEDLHSPIQVPAHTNSAMDGYALKGQDLPKDSIKSFQLVGTALAGKPWAGELQADQCIRIMTGAVMPKGADTVVMQEHAEPSDQTIRIGSGQRLGDNVRAAGEDLQTGQCVLQAGRRLSPSDLGLIASLGIAELAVYRKLRVAFFSTGDELRSIGENLAEGEIYDSNRYTLFGMLRRLGVDLIDMGVVRDTPQAVREGFENASAVADVVITSGGVSVGEADYIKSVLNELGQVNFWKVAMKPGRPLTFGQIGQANFFGLPGNPVSVMVTFYQFVQPALRKMMGEASFQPLKLQARSKEKLRKRPGRTEFQRGILDTNEQGQLQVQLTGEQGSGILRSMSAANCFIILPKASTGVEIGDLVEVQPFLGLV